MSECYDWNKVCYFCQKPFLESDVGLHNLKPEKSFKNMPIYEGAHFDCYIEECIRISLEKNECEKM